jgi:hypothetical protein
MKVVSVAEIPVRTCRAPSGCDRPATRYVTIRRDPRVCRLATMLVCDEHAAVLQRISDAER